MHIFVASMTALCLVVQDPPAAFPPGMACPRCRVAIPYSITLFAIGEIDFNNPLEVVNAGLRHSMNTCAGA